MPLGAWIRHTSATELTSVLHNPLVSLHTFAETVLPADTEVREYVHRLRRLRLPERAALHEKVFTAYGAPLRSDREDLEWPGLAERFATVAGGAFVRAQTRADDDPVDVTLLGQMVVTLYTRFRRWALDGTFSRMLRAVQAHTDAAGDIDWLVSVDSTIVRAHQHAAGGKGGRSTGTKRVITPLADLVVN